MGAIFRNLMFFAVIGIATSACGGGGSGAIASNDGSGTGTGTSNPGGVGSNSVTLQWVAPTTLADNTTAVPPSDISGYRLYYGPAATYTPYYIDIKDGSANHYTVTLPSGTYYFRISAIDSSGHVGLMSTALQKTL